MVLPADLFWKQVGVRTSYHSFLANGSELYNTQHKAQSQSDQSTPLSPSIDRLRCAEAADSVRPPPYIIAPTPSNITSTTALIANPPFLHSCYRSCASASNVLLLTPSCDHLYGLYRVFCFCLQPFLFDHQYRTTERDQYPIASNKYNTYATHLLSTGDSID